MPQLYPELTILSINILLITISYLLVYPKFVKDNIEKLVQFDICISIFSLTIAWILFWNTKIDFSFILFSSNWFLFSLITYFVIETPILFWYSKQQWIDFSTYDVPQVNLHSYKLWKTKDPDSITLDDVLKTKIWICVWEAGLEDEYNEDWQVPVLGIDNIENQFTEPTITLKIKDTNLYASATFDVAEKNIYDISIWKKKKWEVLHNINIKEPIIFISTIKISGKEDCEFKCDSKTNNEAFLL